MLENLENATKFGIMLENLEICCKIQKNAIRKLEKCYKIQKFRNVLQNLEKLNKILKCYKIQKKVTKSRIMLKIKKYVAKSKKNGRKSRKKAKKSRKLSQSLERCLRILKIWKNVSRSRKSR